MTQSYFASWYPERKTVKKTTYEYEMTTFYDRTNHITAMARATANTISVVAQMIGNGTISKKKECSRQNRSSPGRNISKKWRSVKSELLKKRLHKIEGTLRYLVVTRSCSNRNPSMRNLLCRSFFGPKHEGVIR